MTSHSTASKPATSRGRSAQRDGERLLLVEAGDLDDQLHRDGERRYRARQTVIGSHGGLHAHPAAPGTDPARPSRARDRGDRSPGSPSRCSAWASLVGFFVYPTYPNYDSYYSLLWGREVLHLHAAGLRGLPRTRPSTRWRSPPARCCSCSAASATALWVALILASFLVLVAGVYRLGRLAVHAAGRRGRRGAAADPLRLRRSWPRAATSTSRTWRSSCGRRCSRRRARGAASPVLRAARARRACCAPRRGCWPALYFALGGLARDAGASAFSYAALAAIGPVVVGGGRLRSSPATRCSRCTTRAARPRTSAASGRSRELPAAIPELLRRTSSSCRCFVAAVRRARARRRDLARGAMLMPLVLLVAGLGDVRR